MAAPWPVTASLHLKLFQALTLKPTTNFHSQSMQREEESRKLSAADVLIDSNEINLLSIRITRMRLQSPLIFNLSDVAAT